MESEAYALTVGKVVLGLKSLEFALRRFLDYLDMPDSTPPPVSIGQVLPSRALTNHASLGQLIGKFNEAVTQAKHSGDSLDPTLADISDTLADGHIWGSGPEPPLRMVAFSTPRNGLVSCIRDELMDDGWLDTQARRLQEAHTKLAQAGR